MKKFAIIVLAIIAALLLAGYAFMAQEKFGKSPSGARLERIKKSPHYRDGEFHNLNPTPQLAEDTSMATVMYHFLVDRVARSAPGRAFEFSKTDLKNLPPSEDVFVWMGHSSYFIQLGGQKILVDPVLSGQASPFSFGTRAYAGADLYGADDMPDIDVLIITHDHWDHLDHDTVKRLRPKVKRVITGLGTGEHLAHWGFDPGRINELDWGDALDLGGGLKVFCETARHFSGRSFRRNQALWASFVLQTPTERLFVGGDSGYDDNFKKIGDKYGSFDLAILENGQYNARWPYIHFLPGQNIQAMKDLKAKRMIPVHNSKFTIAEHAWDEPMKKMVELNRDNARIIMPAIGQKVDWRDDAKVYERWWERYP